MPPETRLVSPQRVGPPFAIGVLAVLGTIPFVTALEPLADIPRWLAVAVIIALGVGSVGLATVAGAALARDIGLRTLAPERLPGDGVRAYRLPVVVGVGVALVTLGLHASGVALGGDPALLDRWVDGGSLALLASVASAVVTELVLRFGVVTVVVWVAWTSRPATDGGVTRPSVWAGVLVAATLSSAVAVAVAVAAGGIQSPTVAAAAVGPFVGGVVFGILYWRYDLAAAVVAHAVASLLRALVATALF
ncbi:CPBP family intramembrane metalloprotease [Salinigranum halophilum]|jgi:hypothetical protein|uniref:CPBP family intramembrane metalloprotease n=1 Tax=Salinigranum halophilum TaxID=2565931 RepID=UPI00115CCF55|nr:CPBP family intramembrane metalloprotease [Salinigranum halophilum]